MPRQLATLVLILLILYLFWMDRKKSVGVSHSIWIPFIWIILSASRYASYWFKLGSPVMSSADKYLEGSPIDRAVFLTLMLCGIIILMQRKLNWNELFNKNLWIWLFFIFGAISILWSDFPMVSFKRWFKSLGNVVMALVILTEERPYEALGVILRRFAFLLLPLSVLFIKYYPDLGRSYHMGQVMFTGVAGQKNGLGLICLISGIYFSWNLLLNHREEVKSGQQLHFSIYLIIFPMIIWLLYRARSATSLACTIVAVALFIVARHPALAQKPTRIMTVCLASIILLGISELFFNVKDTVIVMLGRQPDLTSRIPMWADLLSIVQHPLIGAGYESFWLGDRMIYIQKRWGKLIQAHNGYVQMYLDLGYIGLFFIVSLILSGLKRVWHCLYFDYPAAILRLCFIIIVSLVNVTEATFGGVSIMFLLFLFSILDLSGHTEVRNTDIR